jgi:dihydroorotase
MGLKTLDRLELPPTADMHVHLRQDKLMELITPQILSGGVDTVLVMVCNSSLSPAVCILFVANMVSSCFHPAQPATTNYHCCGRA